MGILDRLFGGKKSGAGDPDAALQQLLTLYDQPDVKAEGGLGVVGRGADEVRSIGRELYKAGGRERMIEVRDRLRERVPWAVSNVDAIWASIAGYRA